MQLTKFGHSCVRLEKEGQVLVIDPGSFSQPVTALEGAHGVLITHEHADHIDFDVVRAAAQLDTDLHIWAPESVAAQLEDLGKRVSSVSADSQFDAVGYKVNSYGGLHALIHSSMPLVSNVGYLVDDTLFHPGDSFVVPNVEVKNLLVPIHAPWNKISEVIDFVISVRAANAFQIHDGLLNDTGRGMVEGHVTRLGARYGSVFRHLDTGEKLDLA
jgi:L-ascorbate metabolism protein UlaG (beta-lactamase superfamily)